ncbi:MAG: heme-dependent oxidative N-demethylase subunit alpha family protein [Bdellovibrionia bacterium]
MDLHSPARYFPIDKGIYEVAPGLKSLGTPMGNGAADSKIFQFDDEFPIYRANKLAGRQERLSKYFVQENYSTEVSSAVNRFLLHKLCEESPTYFQWKQTSSGGILHCSLTQEKLDLDSAYELKSSSGVQYACALDALCSQVQEDLAICSKDGDGRDWLSALHLFSPSHWAAEDKIGKSFFQVHAPIPGIDKLNRSASALVDAMIYKGPYVRFVWGFGTDRRLNHHPHSPPGWDADEWKGRSFRPEAVDEGRSPFILRYERQVIHGLPEVHAAVFAIRVYFTDGDEIRRNPRERALLRSGLLSMTPESRAYKGLTQSLDQVVSWLDAVELEAIK